MLKGISNFDTATFGDCVVMITILLHTEYRHNYGENEKHSLSDFYDIEYIKGRVTANCFY